MPNMLGHLDWVPALHRPDLLAPPVVGAIEAWPGGGSDAAPLVAEIDPALADTAAFCERYEVPLDASANCVVIAGRRAGETRMAACVVLATTRADVNNVVRRRLDARKASFASDGRRGGGRPAWSTAASPRSGSRRSGRCWSTPRWWRWPRW